MRDGFVTASRKQHFIEELKQLYTQAIGSARQAEMRAAQASDEIQKEARRKDDAKGAVEAGRLAVGHRRRRQRETRELETLIAFAAGGVRSFRRADAVGLGAFVDVSVDGDDGSEERTLFVLPVGAGRELTGPGGDGFVQVITPASPVGKALLGTHIGDIVEVVIDGRDKEWELLDLA
jgi:transcription elongation GreA/GreB family factor